MKTKIRIIAIAAALAMMLGILAACGSGAGPALEDLVDNTSFQDGQEVIIDYSARTVPLSAYPPGGFEIQMPEASGEKVEKNAKAEIDYSNSADGYVMIRFLQEAKTALAVRITNPNDESYIYTLTGDGSFEVYPLSGGDGTYTIGVFEQVEGSRFSVANSVKIEVELADEFAPFLRPNQFVNYNADSNVVALAAELVDGHSEVTDIISEVYNYMIHNISYDRELARTVTSGYIPDLDDVLERGQGICFDYAAVMTAMLRSQGIPTRLVFGYTGNVYHAWIDVFSEETGWVNAAVFFDGETWSLMDPTFAAGALQAANKQFIGDGDNYTAKHLF